MFYSAYLYKPPESFVSTTSQGAQISRGPIISFRTFGFVTAGIVGALSLACIIYMAMGHATLDQCVSTISFWSGEWFLALLCLAINKLRGKSAGFWTKFFTAWGWLTFLGHDLWPAAIAAVHGFINGYQGLH